MAILLYGSNLDPVRVIADCQEDHCGPLTIVSPPVNVEGHVEESAVHQVRLLIPHLQMPHEIRPA